MFTHPGGGRPTDSGTRPPHKLPGPGAHLPQPGADTAATGTQVKSRLWMASWLRSVALAIT